MESSTYDMYLLYMNPSDGIFGVIGSQTDDTLTLGPKNFMELEDYELNKEKVYF